MSVSKSLVISIGLVLLSSACSTPTRWVRTDTTEGSSQAALGRCSLEAEARVPFGGDDTGRAEHVSRLTKLCMQGQGYEQKEEG